jgi:hypothetical protein
MMAAKTTITSFPPDALLAGLANNCLRSLMRKWLNIRAMVSRVSIQPWLLSIRLSCGASTKSVKVFHGLSKAPVFISLPGLGTEELYPLWTAAHRAWLHPLPQFFHPSVVLARFSSLSQRVTMAFYGAGVGPVTKAYGLVLFCKFDLLWHALIPRLFQFDRHLFSSYLGGAAGSGLPFRAARA